MLPPPPRSTLFPYTTLFRSVEAPDRPDFVLFDIDPHQSTFANAIKTARALHDVLDEDGCEGFLKTSGKSDRKSTRLNSSHGYISYAVFCLKKKKKKKKIYMI